MFPFVLYTSMRRSGVDARITINSLTLALPDYGRYPALGELVLHLLL